MYTSMRMLAACCGILAGAASATEGMFTPGQLPAIAADLRSAGLQLEPDELADLTAFPMAAVISLGNCTASFVSPRGLVVTNHHCAHGSLQFHSSSRNNYLENGFLAASPADELPAAPGTRVYVTVQVDDVTERVSGDLDPELPPRERHAIIERRVKALIEQCESDPGHRCQVPPFYGGLQYQLIKRLEIRDVRIAYAPADAIGKYGGDIDNWRWPRHTGDFAFYRAYVAADGATADYSADNVPYTPAHYLKVSAAGLEAGSFVMAMGYPGATSRYARLAAASHTFDWAYPQLVALFAEWIAVIEAAAPEHSERRIRYESRLSGLNNALENLRGQIEGARRQKLLAKRAAREAQLDAWIAGAAERAPFADAVRQLDLLAQQTAAEQKREFWYRNAKRPQLLGAAQRLYRLARERRKPDAERESGYQERDMKQFRQSMQLLGRRYDAAVDKAEWMLFLRGYLEQPKAMRFAAFDAALGLEDSHDAAELAQILDGYYAATTLDDEANRLAAMQATAEQLEAAEDPFMRLAVALYDTDMEIEEASKTRDGRASLLRPRYMQAIIEWQRASGHVAYPDANSTLRVTYGTVVGGSPLDGLIYRPFTSLEGILQKDTGSAPFNAPAAQLERIRAADYGAYRLESLGSVPVNFLSDLDSTGGNSGSATLNARGELVGLLFDGTLESVSSDWLFDPRTTRTIHVDSRYMLWVMEKVDAAGALVEEMDVVR